MPPYQNRWRREENRKKGREIIAIFFVVILLFASANGLLKTFSLKRNLTASRWDGKSPFVAAATWQGNAGLFIFENNPKEVVFLKLNPQTYIETGKKDQPLAKIEDVVAKKDGSSLARYFSINFAAPITNYFFVKSDQKEKTNTLEKLVINFSSPLTPFRILTGNHPGNWELTNITQKDMISLWWQAKSISMEKVKLVDLSQTSEEILNLQNQKVLGLDESALRFKASKYFENPKIKETSSQIKIINASGSDAAGQLAAEFVSNLGFKVLSFTKSQTENSSRILTQKMGSYAANYLATSFNCDIFSPPQGEEGDNITLIVGNDFTARYFE